MKPTWIGGVFWLKKMASETKTKETLSLQTIRRYIVSSSAIADSETNIYTVCLTLERTFGIGTT
jgi:hypothetical protein